jgi:hypothetical protein
MVVSNAFVADEKSSFASRLTNSLATVSISSACGSMSTYAFNDMNTNPNIINVLIILRILISFI